MLQLAAHPWSQTPSHMHLFRTTPLVHQLARQDLTPELQARYLLASLVFYILVYYSGLVVSGALPWTWPSLLEAAALIGINMLGMVRCLDAAGGNDNPAFLVEFTCLSLPVGITTLLPVWALYWLTTWGFGESLVALSASHMQFAMNLHALGSDLFGFLSFVAILSVQFLSYWRLAGLLRRVRQARQAG